MAHLDRLFDYQVEQSQSDACVPGCRVRVRFAGQLVDGYVIERVEASEHAGRLAYLERVVSAEPVLAPDVAALCRYVADRWAGTFADVVRLAVPPRHAAAEKQVPGDIPVASVSPPAVEVLSGYEGGRELVDAIGSGRARAVMSVLPGEWAQVLATLAAATLAAGRGVVLVVPDHRDVARVEAALMQAVGEAAFVVLAAELGPAERYRRFLALRRGHVRCVVGTRAAVWAPVRDLGLIVVWDDGDDLLAEPRAPYCHVRDVAVARAHLGRAGLVLAGASVSAEGSLLVSSGWASPVEPSRSARSSRLPAVRATGDDADLGRDPAARAARLPTVAWQAARDALAAGRPVLVQVPRRGYQLTLQCAQCRAPARCSACAGPLARGRADAVASCRWCGVAAPGWTCAACGGTAMRAGVVGAARTAEELGRAFPGVAVRTSGGDHVVDEVPDRAALVVATPGAEPVAAAGYGAALLLDGWALLGRPDLRAAEETLRRWLNAASLVRPAADGGRVVVVAPGELRPVQALVRWRPDWHAARELEDRTALHLPPAARMAALTGAPDALRDLLDLSSLPAVAETLGPVPVTARPGDGPVERLLVRVPRRDGADLAAALHAAAATRSARKSGGAVRIELDPVIIG